MWGLSTEHWAFIHTYSKITLINQIKYLPNLLPCWKHQLNYLKKFLVFAGICWIFIHNHWLKQHVIEYHFLNQQVWDLTNPVRTKKSHTVQTIASVARIKWRPQRKYHIASCSLILDFSVNIWDIRRPYVPFASFNEHKDVVTGILLCFFFWKTNFTQYLKLFTLKYVAQIGNCI